jgi:hypothetical protein
MRYATRRGILIGAGCSICGGATFQPTAVRSAIRVFDGCSISSAGYKQFHSAANGLYSSTEGLISRNRHFRTTGDSSVDRDLDRALGVIADLFGVNPAFGFYDPQQFQGSEGVESNVMNAFASPIDTAIPGTRGTVAFGWDLFQSEYYGYDRTGMTIMAIAAHEFGHILQYKLGHQSRLLTGYPRKIEINADFLAGYFLGTRKLRNSAISFQPAGDCFIRLGRLATGNPQRTHGDSQERLDAAETGFRTAYVDRKPLYDAVRAGMEYVGAS